MTNYIKNLRIVYFMILISLLVWIGIFSLANDNGTVSTNDSIGKIFQFLIPILVLIFIPMGFVLFKKRLKSITEDTDINSKLRLYNVLVIQRIAFIVGVTIFSAIAFLITLYSLYLAYILISLVFYFLIYPTKDRIKKDLNMKLDSIDLPATEQKNKNYFGKNPLIVILLILVTILLSYISFKGFFGNRVVVPNVQVDNGTINDSIYHNDYLNWTFIIPSDYEIIPNREIESAGEKGNKLFDIKADDDKKPIRLLNISNGLIDFMSNLNPRVLFPNLTSEERYFEILGKRLQNASNDKMKYEKHNQGVILIDSLEFKYVEYFAIGENNKVGFMYISRFNKDYIFDLSLTYRDAQQAIKFLDRLKDSKLNWK
jgi:hypothetical protein